jgi:hypothetical protein
MVYFIHKTKNAYQLVKIIYFRIMVHSVNPPSPPKKKLQCWLLVGCFTADEK